MDKKELQAMNLIMLCKIAFDPLADFLKTGNRESLEKAIRNTSHLLTALTLIQGKSHQNAHLNVGNFSGNFNYAPQQNIINITDDSK